MSSLHKQTIRRHTFRSEIMGRVSEPSFSQTYLTDSPKGKAKDARPLDSASYLRLSVNLFRRTVARFEPIALARDKGSTFVVTLPLTKSRAKPELTASKRRKGVKRLPFEIFF